MPEKCGHADQRGDQITEAHLLYNQNRNKSLCGVSHERQQAARFAEQASHVSGANIAAAGFSDIQSG